MRGKTVTRVLTGTAVAIVVTGVANLAVAFASGIGNRDLAGLHEVGVYDQHNGVTLTGAAPAPAIIDTSHGSVTITYTITVHRYAGPGHVDFNKPIDVDLSLRVRHLLHIHGVTDPGLAAGDPGLPASGGPPPWSDAALQAKSVGQTTPVKGGSPMMDLSSISNKGFKVHFDAFPSNSTPAQTAAAQSKTFSFPVVIPSCGYYEVETGMFVANQPPVSGGGGTGHTSCTCPPPHANPGSHSSSGDYFAVLTRVFVRAVSTTCTAPTPTPTASVQPTATASPTPTGSVAGITAGVPAAGAGPGYGPVAVTLGGPDGSANAYLGLLLLGIGMVLMAMTNGVRRTLERVGIPLD